MWTFYIRQLKSKKSENLERSFKNENDSSTFEDYVYKLPPPKSKSEVGHEINHRTPQNLPKDVKTSMDIETVSITLIFFSLSLVQYYVLYII